MQAPNPSESFLWKYYPGVLLCLGKGVRAGPTHFFTPPAASGSPPLLFSNSLEA